MGSRHRLASWKELSEKRCDPDATYHMTGRMQLIGPLACNRPVTEGCIASMQSGMYLYLSELPQ